MTGKKPKEYRRRSRVFEPYSSDPGADEFPTYETIIDPKEIRAIWKAIESCMRNARALSATLMWISEAIREYKHLVEEEKINLPEEPGDELAKTLDRAREYLSKHLGYWRKIPFERSDELVEYLIREEGIDPEDYEDSFERAARRLREESRPRPLGRRLDEAGHWLGFEMGLLWREKADGFGTRSTDGWVSPLGSDKWPFGEFLAAVFRAAGCDLAGADTAHGVETYLGREPERPNFERYWKSLAKSRADKRARVRERDRRLSAAQARTPTDR